MVRPDPEARRNADWEAAVVPLSAAILAGGQSRRMGQDKALLRITPDTPPMLQLVIERLRLVARDVLVIATNRPEYAEFDVPVVPDRYPGAGTLGGIATALSASAYAHCLVVGCDMPMLNIDLLTWMSSISRTYDVLVPRLPGESRQGGSSIYQTLHAIYGVSCLPAIEDRLTLGQLQVIGFFPQVQVTPIDHDAVRRWDPELRSFYNANTPAAVETVRTWMRAGDSPG